VKRGDEKALFFTPEASVKRIRRVGDLFAPVLEIEQTLPTAFTEAIGAGPPVKLSRWPRNEKKSSSSNPRDKSLREYAAKRDHSRTPEPAARVGAKSSEKKGVHRFVIQKHAASHLHYDWRLEMQGVLRSWAVPKGPPTEPREARLAMHVEDHPVEYGKFEGTIPPGNYGAGTVMLWDEGEYEDITGNPTAAYHAGKMHIVMRGKKLKGEWILVKDRRDEDGNRWLLIKAGEPIAISKKLDDTSVVSGRSMSEITKANDAQWQSNRPAAGTKSQKRRFAGKRVEPRFLEPMQCKPVSKPPTGDDWSFEIKLDGYRCLGVKIGPKVTLFSRNEKKLNDRFPAVVNALTSLPGDFAMDGEIVALDEEGRPAFQLLQNSGSQEVPVYFYAFDLLNLDGEDLVKARLERRRELLSGLLESAEDPIRVSPLLQAPGEQIVEAVEKLGLEGYIAKRAGSLYEPGERSGAWVKQRTNQEQEFVIGGYIPGGHGFDSLLVGVYQGKSLIYSAKVKNGFVPRTRAEIFPALKKVESTQCPFSNLPEKKASRWGESLTAEKMKECRWVRPKLICRVAFVEWTEAGHLRHCSFVAMRDDKKAPDVRRES
jgi:bifunctional non-homologous end joining protein LigD